MRSKIDKKQSVSVYGFLILFLAKSTRARDSMVRPKPMKTVDCDQSKKEPMAPIRIRTRPKLKKEITRMLMSGSFSIEGYQVGNRVIETEPVVIDIDPLEARHIEIPEILRFGAGYLDVPPK